VGAVRGDPGGELLRSGAGRILAAPSVGHLGNREPGGGCGQLGRRCRRARVAAALAVPAATLLLGWALHLHIEGLISGQQSRNRFLRGEIGRLDEQIHEIQDLEQTKQRLLGRMKVIYRLRMSCPEMVRLFDELALGIPRGVYLTKLSQSGRSVVLDARARSNGKISAFMRNIETSRWIGRPVLVLIEHKDATGTGWAGVARTP